MYELTIRERSRFEGPANNYRMNRSYGTKPRVYVSVDESLMPSEEGLEFTVRGENPEMDKAWDKHNRAIVAVWREAAEEALMGTLFHGYKLAFSKYAGCSCPCSPGFILQVPMRDRGLDLPIDHNVDIWVSPKKA